MPDSISPPPNETKKPRGHGDAELLAMGRLWRELSKLRSPAARRRVADWLQQKAIDAGDEDPEEKVDF